MEIDVLILAGGRNRGKLKKYSATDYEALIRMNNIPMVEYVILAVKKAAKTGKIAVVGPKEKLESSINEKVDLIVETTNSMVDNIEKGVDELAPEKYVLIATSDIPLISADMVDAFISFCQNKQADIYYPIISKEKTREKFPDSEKTYVRLRDGSYTGGNIVIIKPEVLGGILEILKKVMLCRKKPWKLSRLLGLRFLLKLLVGKLSLTEIEDRVTEIIGHNSISVKMDYPEIGFDVDKPGDLGIMNEYIKE